jgi:hypothetical protein
MQSLVWQVGRLFNKPTALIQVSANSVQRGALARGRRAPATAWLLRPPKMVETGSVPAANSTQLKPGLIRRLAQLQIMSCALMKSGHKKVHVRVAWSV